MVKVCLGFLDGVTHLEALLRKQLLQAVGNELTPADFDELMKFQIPKMLPAVMAPQIFAYPIRRVDHDMEGMISVEAESPLTLQTPIHSVQDCLDNHICKFFFVFFWFFCFLYFY
jgi:hypothetical protein